jgi:hypothetical protein
MQWAHCAFGRAVLFSIVCEFSALHAENSHTSRSTHTVLPAPLSVSKGRQNVAL